VRRDIKAVNVRFAFFVISVLFFASVTNAQPPDVRMTSCDPTVVRSRIDEMLRDPKTLREPPSLMLFAMNMNSVGGVAEEELGFLWFAGRLRSERFVLFEQGDPSKMYQVYLAVEKEKVRLNMLPSLESDPELLQRVVKRVIAWDKATPDPYRDRPEAQTVELKNRLAEIDKSFSRLPKEFADYLAGINKPPDAWDTPQRRKGVAEYRYAQRCAAGNGAKGVSLEWHLLKPKSLK